MSLAWHESPTDDELRALSRHADDVRGRLDAMAQDVVAVQGIIDELASALDATWDERGRHPTSATLATQEPGAPAATAPRAESRSGARPGTEEHTP